MSLQFVLGNSGSGKTKYMFGQVVLEAGRHPSKNYLVIVPEQFTLATQQMLTELAENHAIMNIDVLSFKRLAYRVFDDMGIRDVQLLEETGKNLILRKVAQEKEEALTVLRPNMGRMGYIGELKSLISEFVQYNITPDALERYAQSEGLSPAFSGKLKDIVTMYRGFKEYMQGRYITAEELLNVLISVAERSQLLRGSVLVFDEFTGFTPIQNRLFYKLLPIAEQIYVLLDFDGREDFKTCGGEHELFYLTKKTIRRLSDMAEELGVEQKAPVVLGAPEDKRFCRAKDLAFMEQNLFRPWYQKGREEASHIHIASYKDAREELTAIARQINHLVQDEGYRYQEIAVVTGATEVYGNYADEIFSRYRIPYFLDRTKEILFHPFVEFVRATLEIVESGFDYEPIMRFLRCGFFPISEEDADILDNYLVATGIRGRRAWQKHWLRMPKRQELYSLERLEETRIAIYGAIAPLADVFGRQDATAADAIRALYGLLTAVEAERQLMERESACQAAGEQVRAKEYGQIYRIVMELFEQFYELLGEEHLSVSEFTEVFEAGLSEAQVASVPPGYDNVTIGDIERTRLSYIKILFFAGVNDGVIPKSGVSGGIISEYEREMMQEAHMELAPGARERVFIERFYLYRNLTKPSDHLYISYVRVDGEGKKVRPSYLADVILKMFPSMKVEEVEDVYAVANCSAPEAAWEYLIRGKRDEAWYALANYFLKEDTAMRGNVSVEELLKAPYAFYRADPVSRAVAEAIYGKMLQSSVTRLEQFAACAYAHFLKYGLLLAEREESGFENVDIGNLYHTALEKYGRYLEESEYDWFGLPEEAREDISERSFREALEEYSNLAVCDTAENRYRTERMMDIFKQTTWALTKQVQAGTFVPTGFELSFSHMDGLEELKVSLGDANDMRLLGRIDRLDLSGSDDRVYVKIIDYKSGNTDFDLIRIYRGLSLQLVVYMNVAMEYTKRLYPQKEIVPGGILYYHIDEPVLDEQPAGGTADALSDELLLALRPDGLVNSEEDIYRAMDAAFEKKSLVIPVEIKASGGLTERGSHVASTEEFQIIEDYVRREMRRQGKRIYDGEIAVNPYKDKGGSSCAYCPYHAVCGIDSRIPGYGYRKTEKLAKEDVLERMKRQSAISEVSYGTVMDAGAEAGH